MIKHKNLFFVLLLLAGGCIEKDLVPGSGEVRLDYDWTGLAAGNTEPSGMVAYVYPAGHGGETLTFEGADLKGGVRLPRGEYRLLTFNRDAERMNYTDLSDYDLARVSLKPLGSKAGEDMLLPVADWLYGGSVIDLRVEGMNAVNSVVRMSPYVRRIHIEVKTDAAKVERASGKLTNTALSVSLKDGKPAPLGNGTTQFDLTRKGDGLVADFVIFGVDSSGLTTGKELKNMLSIIVEDKQGTANQLDVDISDKISGENGNGGKVEEEMAGIGIVTISVDGWEPDGDDNSLTETPIRLAACVGIPVKSGVQAFVGTYGISVEKAGSGVSVYANNKVTVDADGKSVFAKEMYYPSAMVNLYAYAPWSGSVPTSHTLTGNLADDDLLFAKVSGLAETKNEVPLNFGHLMSALRVELIRGVNIPETGLQDVEIFVRNTVTKATLDLKAGRATTSGTTVSELCVESPVAEITGGVAVETCIVPQTVGQGKVLVYIQGVRQGLTYVYKLQEEWVFTAGKRQVLRLTLNDDAPETPTKAMGNIRVKVEVREENL